MPIGDISNREAICAWRTETVIEAARLMRKHHVGCLVIVEDDAEGNKIPIGMLTDRDIAISVVALALDPAIITVNEIMSDIALCVRESAGIAETVALMRARGVRRLPVINAGGALTGLVATDDLLALLAEELSGLAECTALERKHEQQKRRPAS